MNMISNKILHHLIIHSFISYNPKAVIQVRINISKKKAALYMQPSDLFKTSDIFRLRSKNHIVFCLL